MLTGLKLEKPFKMPGELTLVADTSMKPTFGTGIQSIAPAHNIHSLRFSYRYNVPREGCIEPTGGTFTQPLAL